MHNPTSHFGHIVRTDDLHIRPAHRRRFWFGTTKECRYVKLGKVLEMLGVKFEELSVAFEVLVEASVS